MRRAYVVVLSAVMLLLSLLVGGGALTAQDATPTNASRHPLVGSWVLDTDTTDPTNPPSIAYFSADGGYIEADPDGVGVGSWAPTGETTGELTFSYPDDQGSLTTIRASLEVAPDGQSLTADYTLEFLDPTTGEWSGEIGPGHAEATRIVVEGPGDPISSFEDIFGAPAGTPVATPAT